MTPSSQREARSSLVVVSLLPTTRPRSLIAVGALRRPSVPRSVIAPFCHKKACCPPAVEETPITWPRLLIATASLAPPSSEPRSVGAQPEWADGAPTGTSSNPRLTVKARSGRIIVPIPPLPTTQRFGVICRSRLFALRASVWLVPATLSSQADRDARAFGFEWQVKAHEISGNHIAEDEKVGAGWRSRPSWWRGSKLEAGLGRIVESNHDL